MLTWKQKTAMRILLLITEMLTEDTELKKEVRSLSTHICYHEERKAA